MPPRHILEAQAKLVGLASLHAPDGNSARKGERERTTGGKPVFPGTGLFLYFPGPLLYF